MNKHALGTFGFLLELRASGHVSEMVETVARPVQRLSDTSWGDQNSCSGRLVRMLNSYAKCYRAFQESNVDNQR